MIGEINTLNKTSRKHNIHNTVTFSSFYIKYNLKNKYVLPFHTHLNMI